MAREAVDARAYRHALEIRCQKIGFVGYRSQDLADFRRVLEEGLGMARTDVVEDQARYRLADGTLLELYSEANEFHGFFKTGAVVGFAVEDFDRSWTRLTRIGIEALTDIQQEDGQKWVHFRLPDGTIVELIGGTRAATE